MSIFDKLVHFIRLSSDFEAFFHTDNVVLQYFLFSIRIYQIWSCRQLLFEVSQLFWKKNIYILKKLTTDKNAGKKTKSSWSTSVFITSATTHKIIQKCGINAYIE
jgi:hypothetical protein